jgi:hypothetical protein
MDTAGHTKTSLARELNARYETIATIKNKAKS